MGSDNPRDPWQWMVGYEDNLGGNGPAIADIGNFRNGRMFPII